MIMFNDTERLPITVPNIMDLKAFNSLLGTREFRGSAPLIFNGPGMLPGDNVIICIILYVVECESGEGRPLVIIFDLYVCIYILS
jgi:hypothetical protein